MRERYTSREQETRRQLRARLANLLIERSELSDIEVMDVIAAIR